MSAQFQFEKAMQGSATGGAPIIGGWLDTAFSHTRIFPQSEMLIVENELQPQTFKWLATLPAGVRPDRLAKAFPRIANQMAHLAARPVHYGCYLDDLLIDRRGGRRGFPAEVRADIEALQLHFLTGGKAKN